MDLSTDCLSVCTPFVAEFNQSEKAYFRSFEKNEDESSNEKVD